MNASAQSVRVERLHDWFALQLHFAEVFAAKTGLSLDKAVTFYTNLHRRFGFGRPSIDGASPDWDGFVRQLADPPVTEGEGAVKFSDAVGLRSTAATD